jgi:hypothetical protein
MAARYAGKTEPQIVEYLERLRNGKQRRAAAAVKFSLEKHLELMRTHPRVGGLLRDGIESEAMQLLERLTEHEVAVKTATKRQEEVAGERNAVIGELQRITGDVRALATVLARTDPELARDYGRAAEAASRP